MSSTTFSRMKYYLPFVMALLITSPLIVWTIDRRDAVTVIDYHLEPTHVAPGGLIFRVFTVVRRAQCTTQIDQTIVDRTGVRWVIEEPQMARPGQVGGDPNTIRAPTMVPPFAAPGRAELRLTATRSCNPVQRLWPLVTNYPTLTFIISEPVR